jgi:Na+/H+-dicarboxylate symporter
MNSRWFAPIIIASALLGWFCATLLPELIWLDTGTELVRTAFFAALKMIIAPLIFFSLVAGVLELRNTSNMGRLGAVTLGYYFTTTCIAICIGLVVVFFFHPWTQFPPLVDDPMAFAGVTPESARLINPGDGSITALLNNLLKAMLVNPFKAMAEMNVLGILVGAILFGLALALTIKEDSPISQIFSDLAQATYRLAGWVLTMLPLGLFAISYQLAGQIDFSTVTALAQLAGVVFGATLFHGLIVLPAIAWWAAGLSPWKFFAAVAQPLITALSTSSSAATLPLSMTTAESKLGVERAKCAFVLPLGATANMDGTALFEGIAAVFLAYMFGIDLTATAIIAVFLVAMLSSVGAPGIPSGSMAGMQMVMLAVGIPLEAIGLLLLIERPLDTFRTAVNVEGDLVGCLVAKRLTQGQ